MKIYTKGGDRGTTSLFGGKRVDKDDLRIQAYGSVDELNSLLGVITSDLRHTRSNRGSDVRPEGTQSLRDPRGHEDDRELEVIATKLGRIQAELMVLGSDLATPVDVKIKIPQVTKAFATRLEKEIDVWEKSLSPLKNFILPGGSKAGSMLHLARTVARRAEREIIAISKQEKVNKNAKIYINRLSDWLFVAARYVNKLENVKEIPWQGRKGRRW